MPISPRVMMVLAASVGLTAAAPFAAGQISLVTQERSVHTTVDVTSGATDEDFAEPVGAEPFISSVHSEVTGAAGASATATAGQNTASSATQITGTLSSFTDVRTGATFVVGEGDGASNVLYIFNLTAATAVTFTASGSLVYVGSNPNGEPSDLYGMSYARLVDGITEEVIAGFQLFPDAGADNATFTGTLPAGQYVILAKAQTHGYSADLLGPPARTGTAAANTTFSLSVAGGACGSADYDCDGDTGTDADIEAFFRCLGGNCPSLPCTSTADFNGDGDTGTDADIEAFFRVLAGGHC